MVDAVQHAAALVAQLPGGRWAGNARVRFGAALLAVLTVVLAENLFGRELNAFFIRFPGIDKVLHIVEYLLIFIALHAVAGGAVPKPCRRAWLVLGAGLALAFVDESLQRLAPGRTVEGMDLVADACGLTFGWLLMARPARAVAVPAGVLAVAAATFVTWRTYALLIDYSRALRYERERDFVRAREYYGRARAAGLSSAGLYNEMAWVEVESEIGDPARAVEYARTALRMQPGSADVLDTYGWALHHAGRSREALPILMDAFRKKPDMFCIHYHLGSAYLALNDREAAEAHFRSQLERTDTREAAFAKRALANMGAEP